MLTIRTLALSALLLMSGCREFIVTTTEDSNDGDCSTEHCTLREAITAANQNSGEDLIRIPAGYYNLTRSGDNEDNNATGDLDITESVVLLGESASNTIIDGGQHDRVLHAIKGKLSLTQLTIQNGRVQHEWGYGGGIYAGLDASLMISNAVIRNNWSASPGAWGGGGGIFSFGDVEISDSVISGNFSYHAGGGIAVKGNLKRPNWPSFTLQRVKISDNGAYYHGGGVYVLEANTRIELSVIEGNRAAVRNSRTVFGGGIYHYYGALSIVDSSLRRNWVNDWGGGMYSGSEAPVYLLRTIVDGNVAYGEKGSGGGLYVHNAQIESSSITRNEAMNIGGGMVGYGNTFLRNVTISQNKAQVGAMALYNGRTELDYVTIAHNQANQHTAGVFMRLTSELWPSNSIIANNTMNGMSVNCQISGPINSRGYNLSDDTSCNLNDATDMIADPLLLPLAHAGYNATEVHPLHATSPAVNAASLEQCPTHDQSDYPRPVGGQCDRGAYEYRKSNPDDVVK